MHAASSKLSASGQMRQQMVTMHPSQDSRQTQSKKYLPIFILTIQGCMHQRRQCIRCTTTRAVAMLLAREPNMHESYCKVVELPGITCTDQTGRFLVRSRSGNNYLMIMHDYDFNAILAEATPDRKSNTLQKAFKIIYNKICLNC